VQAPPEGFQLGYSILGLTDWMTARCEEVNPSAELLDHHGRFPATSSNALRHGYLERPIVDEWLGVLRQLVQRFWPRLALQQHQFRIVLSHDVDAPSVYGFGRKRTLVRGIGTSLLKHRDLAWALQAPRIRLASRLQLHPADPFNTFEWLMDQSDAAGIRSAFYYICGRTNPQLDAQYEPEHPAIRSLMRRIHQRGHEIGLHPTTTPSITPQPSPQKLLACSASPQKKASSSRNGAAACIFCVGSGPPPPTAGSRPASTTTAPSAMPTVRVSAAAPATPTRCSIPWPSASCS
jgi:hypothetical protein